MFDVAGALAKAWAMMPCVPVNGYMNANQSKVLLLVGVSSLFFQTSLFAYRHKRKAKLKPVGKLIRELISRSGSRDELDDDIDTDSDDGDHAPANPNDLRECVTVLITTSPLKINPSTALIEHTLETTIRLAKGLKGCRTIVICDGYKVGEACRYRRGEVTEAAARDYEAYTQSLDTLSRQAHSALSGAEILVLNRRHGFGMALKQGMALVQTEFVVVLQHDRDFRRPVAISRVVRSMRQFNQLKSVSFPTTTTDPSKYIEKVQGSFDLNLAPFIVHDDSNMLSFVPMVQWYDSAHIARTKHYRDFVFSTSTKRVSAGGFIEDQLGQMELQQIKHDGLEVHHIFGNYVLNDGNALNPVRHLDGHDSRILNKVMDPQKQGEKYVYGC